MYRVFNNVEKIIDSANEYVTANDRDLFAAYFKVIEKYCADNGIVIGDKIGVDLLIGRPKSRDSYDYRLYTYDAYRHAQNLADMLFYVPPINDIVELDNRNDTFAINQQKIGSSHVAIVGNFDDGDGEITGGALDKRAASEDDKARIDALVRELEKTKTIDAKMQTNIMYREFTIFVHTRQVAKIYQFDKNKEVLLQNVLPAITRHGYFATDVEIRVLQPELQLIDIYHRLYLPYAENTRGYLKYHELYEMEHKIYPMLQLSNKAMDKRSYDDYYLKMDDAIINNFLAFKDVVLIGDYAISFVLGENTNITKPTVKRRIQIISDEAVETLCVLLGKHFKTKFTSTFHLVNLPTDFQLTKHTIYVTNKEQRLIPVIDVFNSTAYELIPYTVHGGVKIAGLYALLRFKLIDLWAMRVLSVFDAKQSLIMSIDQISNQIKQVRELVVKRVENDPQSIFQTSNFLGRFTNEMVVKKKLIQAKGRFFADQYPCVKYVDSIVNKTEIQKAANTLDEL